MDKPIKVQRKRQKGWRMPPNTISVTRPGPWGNPYYVFRDPNTGQWFVTFKGLEGIITRYFDNEPAARLGAIALFKDTMTESHKANARKMLKGKNLACFCSLDQPCHADVWLEIANSIEEVKGNEV